MDWGAELVTAWNAHDAEALVPLFASACRYTDTPFRMTWEGHDGIRALYAATSSFHPDFRFSRRSGFCDGKRYAWEWTTDATFGGEVVTYGGISIGTLDEDGLIVENRDYWNPKDVPILNP